MAKTDPETRTCVLKLRLGACLTAPTKRMVADLHAASALYNKARNAMVRHWERWCEDHLFAERAVEVKGKTLYGKDAAGKSDRAVVLAPPRPRQIVVREALVPDKYQLPKGFETELYHAGRAVAPTLAPCIMAGASNTILSGVNKTMPFAPGRRARRVWQAVLGSEAGRPVFRSTDLLVPAQGAKFALTRSGFTLRFAVWDRSAGRRHLAHVCRIATRRLSPGYRRILTEVALGTYKLRGSELVFHAGSRIRPGAWMLHLCYERPQDVDALKLDVTRVAQFVPNGREAAQPFSIGALDMLTKDIGDCHVLEHEYARLDMRRLGMRVKHKYHTAGRRGHGRQRNEAAIRPVTRAVRQLMHRFTWHVVAEVVRYCERNDCGAVAYSEPALALRAQTWFAGHDIPYDWTTLESRLKHKLWLRKIVLCER